MKENFFLNSRAFENTWKYQLLNNTGCCHHHSHLGEKYLHCKYSLNEGLFLALCFHIRHDNRTYQHTYHSLQPPKELLFTNIQLVIHLSIHKDWYLFLLAINGHYAVIFAFSLEACKIMFWNYLKKTIHNIIFLKEP